jgi:hypothetical protein
MMGKLVCGSGVEEIGLIDFLQSCQFEREGVYEYEERMLEIFCFPVGIGKIRGVHLP